MRGNETFRALYERELPHVFRAVLLLSGDRRLAEDAAQEAFARALARWRRLEHEPWVAGWVTTTALNVARRQLRRSPSLAQPVLGVDADADAAIDTRAAIRALPRRQQEAVVLHYLLDRSVAQTAAAMGCDDGTVKTHLARARSALRAALQIDEDEPSPGRLRHG